MYSCFAGNNCHPLPTPIFYTLSAKDDYGRVRAIKMRSLLKFQRD
jgi:hypothetical protein